MSVSSVARMAGPRSFRFVDVSRFNGRRSQGVQRNSKTLKDRERPGRGGFGRVFLVLSQVLSYASIGTFSCTGSSARGV
jgi:hypothetical protein